MEYTHKLPCNGQDTGTSTSEEDSSQLATTERGRMRILTSSDADSDVPGLVTHFRKHFSFAFCSEVSVRTAHSMDSTHCHEFLSILQRHFALDRLHDLLLTSSHVYAQAMKLETPGLSAHPHNVPWGGAEGDEPKKDILW